MLPAFPILITIFADIAIFIGVGYYLLQLRNREKKIEKKEEAIDTNYHHVVDEALGKERKILDDATTEADHIITDAKTITTASKQEVNEAIQDLVKDIQKEGHAIAHAFTSEYTTSLKDLTALSLTEYQTIMSDLQTGLKKQIQDFHATLLPQIEKELDAYKKARMKQVDHAVIAIIQKASQEIFNKSLSSQEHQTIIIESLE